MPPRCWTQLWLLVFAATSAQGAAPPTPLADALGDPLPPGAVARYGTHRLRHESRRIDLLQFTADSKRLFSLGEHTMRLWDVATGKQLARRGNTFLLNESTVAPTGTGGVYVVHGLLEYYADLNAPSRRLFLEEGGRSSAAAVSPDGKLLAVGHEKGLRLLEVPAGKLKAEVRSPNSSDGQPSGVNELAFTRDGKTLAGRLHDDRVVLWNVETAKQVRVFSAGLAGGYGMAFSPDGQLLAVIYSDARKLRLLSVKDGVELEGLQTPVGSVNCVGFSENGKELLTFNAEWRVSRHEPRSGKLIAAGPQQCEGQRTGGACAFSPDGTKLAYEDGCNIHILDVKSGKALLPGLPGRRELYSARWARGEVVCEAGNGLRVWDPLSGDQVRAVPLKNQTLDVHPDGRWVAEVPPGGGFGVRDFATKKVVWKDSAESLHTTARFSEDGRLIAVATLAMKGRDIEERVELRDAATGKLRRTIKVGPAPDYMAGMPGMLAPAASFSSRGDVVVHDGQGLSVHDAATGKVRHTLRCPQPRQIAFSPDDRLMAVLGADGTIYVHRLGQARPLFEVVVQSSLGLAASLGESWAPLWVYGPVAFSPDGEYLVAASGPHVRVWGLTGRPVTVLRGHAGAVQGLAFSPDARRLVSTSADGTGLVWDMARVKRTKETTDWASLRPDARSTR